MAVARWGSLCIDTSVADGSAAAFWGAALGLDDRDEGDGVWSLRDGDGWAVIWVNTVPEPRTVKHRVHLDLSVASIEPLLDLGARVVRPREESGLGWTVLADPEGGELCAFVRDGLAAEPPAVLYEVVVDTADAGSAVSQARWWADVLGGRPVDSPKGFSWVEDVPGLPCECIVFGPVPEPKTVKNRIHWDVEDADLAGLVARGATVVAEPGPGHEWHVLADPDGNEFCAFAPE